MKVICTHLLLSVACFSLCLALSVPVRADGNAARPLPSEDAAMSMTRADKLLLLSNVASLWKLHVKIGTVQPDGMKPYETFGLVKNGQLSPSFVAHTALQIMLRDADAPQSSAPEWQAPPRPADVPQRYDFCIPLDHLETVAREWLGLPFETSPLSQIDGILRKGNCLYVDSQRLLNSWPCPMYNPNEHDIFAQPFKVYPERDTWVMKGEVWDIRQGQNDALDVSVCETFRLVVKKTGKLWRIFSLDFGV